MTELILILPFTSPRATTKPPCSRERSWVRWKNFEDDGKKGGRWKRHLL